jgi:hypothetical protein
LGGDEIAAQTFLESRGLALEIKDAMRFGDAK